MMEQPADTTVPVASLDRHEIERTHAVFDQANVPRIGVDKTPLTLEQRATILLHWYQRGRR